MFLFADTFKKDKKPVLKKGDRVLLPDYKGTQIKFEGQEYDIYRDDEILGIIEEKNE